MINNNSDFVSGPDFIFSFLVEKTFQNECNVHFCSDLDKNNSISNKQKSPHKGKKFFYLLSQLHNYYYNLHTEHQTKHTQRKFAPKTL